MHSSFLLKRKNNGYFTYMHVHVYLHCDFVSTKALERNETTHFLAAAHLQ